MPMHFPSIDRLETARLELLPVADAHLDDLLAVNGDEAVTRFLPYATWRTRADAEAWLGRMTSLVDGGAAQQLVLARRDDGRAIGTLLLFRFDAGSARLELGYALGRVHWGRGLMHEALSAVCTRLFGTPGVRRIEAEVNPANRPSCRLLERLGFVHEGTLRQRWVGPGGTAYDTRLYGLLAGEWPAPDTPAPSPA